MDMVGVVLGQAENQKLSRKPTYERSIRLCPLSDG